VHWEAGRLPLRRALGAMARFLRNLQFRQHFAQTAQLGMPGSCQANLFLASVLAEAIV
jgi:hypothetical protein